MPHWLLGVSSDAATHPWSLALRLVIAFGVGGLVALIYQRTIPEPSPSLRTTLVLLTILIGAVTQVIGDSVARAFSLVGALSIVRFRTVVQDTRDTAFVIFAVAVGMAVGAGDFWVAGFSLVTVGIAASLLALRRPRVPEERSFQLSVTLTLGFDAETVLAPVFRDRVTAYRVTGVSTASRGAALETTFHIRLAQGASPVTLVEDLNALEGVQSVQLRSENGG